METAMPPPGPATGAEHRADYDIDIDGDGSAEVVAPNGGDDGDSWTVTVAPGADPATFAAELSQMPAHVRFVEAFGDVQVVLVFAPRAGSTDGQARIAARGAAADERR